jgi:hypothetical protein
MPSLWDVSHRRSRIRCVCVPDPGRTESSGASVISAQPWHERAIAPVERASFWRRGAALALDEIVLALAEAIIAGLLYFAGVPWWWIVAALIPVVYYAWAYSTSGQTSGKKILRGARSTPQRHGVDRRDGCWDWASRRS